MIEVKDLTVYEGGETLLDGVSFKWKNGLIYGVLGNASSGKDALLRALGGALDPDEGQIKINGFDLVREPMRAKACIGFLPKESPFYGELTVLEFLHFVAEVRGLSYEKAVRRINRALESVGLEESRCTLCSSLSSSAALRAGLAQTLIGSQDILILEEPTAELDPLRAGEIRALLGELSEGRTLILGSSSVEEVRKLCDHVLLLSEGRVELDLPVEEIGAELGAHFRAGKREADPAREARRRALRAEVETDGEYEIIDLEGEKGGEI